MTADHTSIAPETCQPDESAPVCLCGATPLLTEANGWFYLSCPPCWARTHKVASADIARAQWTALVAAAMVPSPAICFDSTTVSQFNHANYLGEKQ